LAGIPAGAGAVRTGGATRGQGKATLARIRSSRRGRAGKVVGTITPENVGLIGVGRRK
jgi:hypothetical protein